MKNINALKRLHNAKILLCICIVLLIGGAMFILFYNSMPDEYETNVQPYAKTAVNSKEIIYASISNLKKEEAKYEAVLSDSADTTLNLPTLDGTPKTFCDAFGVYAIYVAKKLNMKGDPLWLLAQWGQESGWGQYAYGYNVGGIKPLKGNKSATAWYTVDEMLDANVITKSDSKQVDINGTPYTAYKIVGDEYGRYQVLVRSSVDGAGVWQWYYYYVTPLAFAEGKARTLTNFPNVQTATSVLDYCTALTQGKEGAYFGDPEKTSEVNAATYAAAIEGCIPTIKNNAPAWVDQNSAVCKEAEQLAVALVRR